MATVLQRRPMTTEEFLAWEERQELWHEYVAGEIRAMSGAAVGHNDIADNVLVLLRTKLRGMRCRARRADIKTRAATGDILYPDVMVSCTPRGRRETVIDDPVVVVEVSSPSTQKRDDTAKRWAYQSIPTMRHVVFVSSEAHLVEVASPNPDGSWTSVFYRGLDAVVALPALDAGLPLAQVYEGVDLDEPTAGSDLTSG